MEILLDEADHGLWLVAFSRARTWPDRQTVILLLHPSLPPSRCFNRGGEGSVSTK